MPSFANDEKSDEGTVMTAQILIADRDPLVWEQCSRFLAAHGYDVAVAADGLQCVEQLRSGCLDLLVLDPELLWGGGPGVLDWLTCEEPVKPVKVVITDGHRLGRLLKRFNGRIAAQLKRPTGLASMMDYVCELQRMLESNGTAIHGATPRRETVTRSI
jgi:CheY-like chemotaxis protein